jgi:plastocyanin
LPTTPAPATATIPPKLTTVPTISPQGGQGLTLHLTEKGNKFIPATLTTTAGAPITLVLDDQDPNPHNFALYSSQSYSTAIFRSPVVTGPVILTYTFPAPATPGIYYFRSDPDAEMTGTLHINSRVVYGY